MSQRIIKQHLKITRRTKQLKSTRKILILFPLSIWDWQLLKRQHLRIYLKRLQTINGLQENGLLWFCHSKSKLQMYKYFWSIFFKKLFNFMKFNSCIYLVGFLAVFKLLNYTRNWLSAKFFHQKNNESHLYLKTI